MPDAHVNRDGLGHIEQATGRRVMAIMALRLAVISGFIVVLALLLPGDNLAFYALMAFAYIATIPYALWLRNNVMPVRGLYLQFVVDLVWITGLVYFTGGLDSPLALLYPLVILAAGIVAGPGLALVFTVLSGLAYVLIVVLLEQGILAPYAMQRSDVGWPLIVELLVIRLIIFACFGAASAYVSGQCHYATRKVERLREVAEIIFRNVKAGLVLLDASGKIRMVNDRACELLEQPEETLLGHPLSVLVLDECSLEISPGAGNAKPCYFRRANGSAFPASYEISTVELPGEILGDGRRAGMITCSLMVFSDIARMVEMQEEAKASGRMRAAANMAAEIAHQIRNPLAAVSGAVQLLNKLEMNVANGVEGSKALLDKERAGLCEQVIRESSRLDRIIEDFIDYAEGSPDALSRLRKHTRDLGIPDHEPDEGVVQEEFSWNKP
ncbi:MAG: PAS domain-containing protein [Spartobacteria bacterium]|nr:PAS domain-containing protein [Spartobacteria bacterium]